MTLLQSNNIWLYIIISITLLIIIFLFIIFKKKKTKSANDKEKIKRDYTYYGYDKTIHSKRKYILLTLIDSEKTEFEKLKLASILFSATINLQKALRLNKKDANKLIDIIDSKVIINKYPVYLLLEVSPSDLSNAKTQPELTSEYVSKMKNLVFYSTRLYDIKEFMENR